MSSLKLTYFKNPSWETYSHIVILRTSETRLQKGKNNSLYLLTGLSYVWILRITCKLVRQNETLKTTMIRAVLFTLAQKNPILEIILLPVYGSVVLQAQPRQGSQGAVWPGNNADTMGELDRLSHLSEPQFPHSEDENVRTQILWRPLVLQLLSSRKQHANQH